MNWIDVILVLVMFLSVITGWKRGFILGIVSLAKWTGSFLLGYFCYPYTALWLESILSLGAWLLPTAFLATVIIARILLGFILVAVVSGISEQTNRDGVNRMLGIIPGAVNGWIIAIIISSLLLVLPWSNQVTAEARTSQMATRLAMHGEWANRKLAPVFDEAVRETMSNIPARKHIDNKVDLSFTYNRAIARPALEAEMLKLVNKERIKAGIRPLKADPEMTGVARAHSQDMFERGYFAHDNPDGKNPFDRMREANVSFKIAGENLALAQTVEIAHRNLMNSPGHRTNILNPKFGRLGIGILDGGFYGLMISQEFRD